MGSPQQNKQLRGSNETQIIPNVHLIAGVELLKQNTGVQDLPGPGKRRYVISTRTELDLHSIKLSNPYNLPEYHLN